MKIYYNEYNSLDKLSMKKAAIYAEALSKHKQRVAFWSNFDAELLNKIIKIKNEKL